MPVPGFTAPGQRETIHRGERTPAKVVIKQAAGLSLVLMVFLVLVTVGIMLTVQTEWKWIVQNWRKLLWIPVAPWLLGCLLAGFVLFIEMFDPNYPAPRKATDTSRVIWPWSRERVQPKSVIRARMPGTVDFSLDDNEETF
jgi:hypothetical protein